MSQPIHTIHELQNPPVANLDVPPVVTHLSRISKKAASERAPQRAATQGTIGISGQSEGVSDATGFQPVLTVPTRTMTSFTDSLAGDRLETCPTFAAPFAPSHRV